MTHRGPSACLATLMHFGVGSGERDARAMRQAIDEVLSCDKLVRCEERLECTWLASQLADRMHPR